MQASSLCGSRRRHKKLKLEVEQLELQIQKAYEDQHLEVDRQ